MFQIKEKGRKDLNDTEISNLFDKEFKVMVIKMPTELRRMDEHSKNFNKKIAYIRKQQPEVTELKNTIAELKCTLDCMKQKSRSVAGRQSNETNLSDRAAKKKKNFFKMIT